MDEKNILHNLPIRSGIKVLIVGDSHTAGYYGSHLDKMVRNTGAVVQTYGSWSSYPEWWLNGTPTLIGFCSRDENEKIKKVKAGISVPTPKIKNLLKQQKPDVVIVTLGGNMIDFDDKSIVIPTKQMANIIQQSGAGLFWVGPPQIRLHPAEQLNRLYDLLQKAVTKHVLLFIDSRPYTHYPQKGGDGIHYTGKEGKLTAINWAEQVFYQIQNLKIN